jgi:hypothetical protein
MGIPSDISINKCLLDENPLNISSFSRISMFSFASDKIGGI